MPRAPRYAVVMAGGSGTRFWPRSRLRTPKQLLPIVGARTMLQETVARLAPGIRRDRIFVVTAEAQAAAVRRQLRATRGVRVLVEPQGRNTAAAIALAALHIRREAPDAVMAVLPADHAIPDRVRFGEDLALALTVAETRQTLVTIGIPPTHPETGYGYIRRGAALPDLDGRAFAVAAFIEKPDRARAEQLLAGGDVRWNAGIFAWSVPTILGALRTHVPDVLAPLEAASGKRPQARALAAAYRKLPSISIDVGVLERATDVAMVEARFPWSDVGSWASIEPFWRGDDGNAVRGRTVAIESRGCIVDSPQRVVALLGVDDLIVVDTPDALLVCPKGRAQDVRLVVDELRRQGLGRLL